MDFLLTLKIIKPIEDHHYEHASKNTTSFRPSHQIIIGVCHHIPPCIPVLDASIPHMFDMFDGSTHRCLMVNLAIGGSSLIWLQSCETLHRPTLGDARHKPPGPWISSGREQKTDFNHQTSYGKHGVSTCLYHQQVVITWDS